MPLTIAIEGLGVIANSDSLTADTGHPDYPTTSGAWAEDGLGSMSLSTETYLRGSACVATAYSNKSGFSYYDIKAGFELDFDVAGSEEGQFIYIWVFFPTPGLGESVANGGFTIRLATSLSDYRDYMVSASDNLNGWYGDWKCFVIDPTKAGSVTDTGTYDEGSIRYIGCYMDATDTAKGDNLFISQIAVGSGLRITGTSTTAWEDIVAYCTDYANRAWGMVQERDGIYYVYGKIYIGDAASQSAVVEFGDTGRVIRFATTQYYYSSSWVTMADIDYAGIVVEDHSSYETDFVDGTLVGSDQGRSGSVFIGDPELDVSMDLYGGNNAASITSLYGTILKDLTGALNSGDDSGHSFFSVSFNACAQFDPVGAPVIRNCVFAGYAGVDAALLWNSNIDIANCVFAGNTDVTNDPAAIEHEATGNFSYSGLTFSGNDYDIKNSNNGATCDSYSESNRDGDEQLNDTDFAVGQSFNGNGGVLGHVYFVLSKSGTPTGNMVAKIYSHSGTYGTDGVPDALLATSKVLSVADLDGTPTLTKFIFPLAEQITLANGTKYFAVLEYLDGTSSNYVLWGRDASSPSHGGNIATYTSSWAYDATKDGCFYVRTGGIVNVSASSGSNPSQSLVNDSGTPEGTTSIINTVTITVNTIDANNEAVGFVRCSIHKNADGTELMNEDSTVLGVATKDFNYPGSPVPIYWRVRESPDGGGDRYKPDSGYGEISADGYSVTVTMRPETVT